jgi:hypothetical protein
MTPEQAELIEGLEFLAGRRFTEQERNLAIAQAVILGEIEGTMPPYNVMQPLRRRRTFTERD